MSPPDSPHSESEELKVAGSEKKKEYESSGRDGNANEEVMDSLGVALAGMNMSTPSASGFTGYSQVAAAPFAMASGSSMQNVRDGWGNFSDPNSAVFSGMTASPGGRDTSVDSSVRNESLELFLSQDPSHALGDDVFRLSNPGQSLPSSQQHDRTDVESHSNVVADASSAFRLSGQLAPGPLNHSSGFGDMRSAQESNNGATARRRTDSPSCSVTGTTTSSRSASPFANNSDVGVSGRTIHAYQRFDSAPVGNDMPSRSQAHSFAEDDRSTSFNSLTNGHVSSPGLGTPYKGRSQGKSVVPVSPYEHGGFDRAASFTQPHFDHATPPPQQQQQILGNAPAGPPATQPQVLYMAVPSPDGRGQVLQPVQMVQLPGKPYTYVVPPGAAGFQGMNADGSQPMMVLPPMSNQSPDYGVPSLENRSPSDSRNRIGNYDASRQYTAGLDSTGLPRDDYSRGASLPGQYQPDPILSSLYSAPQRPPLDALLGQVRRLSRDQVGCRLVQQALDEEGPMAATLILNEGLPFWGEAMVDPFGNYLFQKILEKVTPEERIMLVKSVSSRLVNASLNLHGTRSVQKVVELCAQDEESGTMQGVEETAADILTKSLAPAAARLCIDSHGNHVIQRILLKLGPRHSKFVFDAVAASVGDVARHRHGCCVIQRCLDSPPAEARSYLVHCIVEKALELMQDAYGNYVVQYVLDVCSDQDVHDVCESVVGKVNLLAIQKFSSNVMEKCLERCADRVREMYLQEMSDPERIRELMMDPFGNYVVQRALSVATHAQAIRLVEAMRPHLIATQSGGPNGQRNGGVRNTAGGRRIIAKICRRFPNFTLNAVGSQEDLYSQSKTGHRHHQQPQQQQPPPHHYHQQPPMLAAYPPVGASPHGKHYSHDPRLAAAAAAAPPPIAQQQAKSYYGMAGKPYYDPHFGNGAPGGYPGL